MHTHTHTETGGGRYVCPETDVDKDYDFGVEEGQTTHQEVGCEVELGLCQREKD